MGRRESLTPDEARRAVLTAQGFAGSMPTDVGRRTLLSQIRRLGVIQIDSVSVLSRAHYLPLFSRLGGYDRSSLDRLADGRPRQVFEYWAHEASLLPVATQPLLRWRMAHDHAWGSVSQRAAENPRLVAEVLACVAEAGPATAAAIEHALGRGGADRPTDHWGWNWSDVKHVLEHLFWTGEITTSGRDSQFRRRYALTSEVLPAAVLAAPTPEPAAAVRELVAIAGRALGVATALDLRDWFRLPAGMANQAIAELVDAGDLLPVAVPGWPAAWRHRSARVARRIDNDALLVPFDPLIWERTRVERLFAMRYRIEIYVPAAKRQFGYYVLPFLQGERLTARVDLKADRVRGVLRVLSVWGHRPDVETATRLAVALQGLADWLAVPNLEFSGVGDLADATATAARVSVT